MVCIEIRPYLNRNMLSNACSNIMTNKRLSNSEIDQIKLNKKQSAIAHNSNKKDSRVDII